MNIKIVAWILLLFVLIGSVSAAIKTIQDEDDEKTYTADGISYTITVTYINDGKVKFRVNDETTSQLSYHETYKFEDSSIVFVREILEEEILEGPDKVIFNFYPAICADPDCIFEIADTEEEQEQTEEEQEEIEEETEEEVTEEEQETEEELTEEETIEEEAEKKSFLKRVYLWFVKWFIWWPD